MNAADFAYPLHWPEGRPRTPPQRRQRARFATPLGQARDELLVEVERLGGRYPVISTDLKLRLDGLFRAGQAEPDDPGAALYFELDGEQLCFACDRWDRLRDNVRAICKTIEALRGIERWGSGDAMRRAFRGFAALPAAGEDWRSVLGLQEDEGITFEGVRARHRAMALHAHPDRGGNPHEMVRLNQALEAARKELGA